MIEHFRNGRTDLPTHPELAPQNDQKEIDTMSPFCNRQASVSLNSEPTTKTKYDWGKHERSGIEETWGLWLQHAFKDKDAADEADEAAVWKSFDRLSDDIWRDAKNNYLIKNPYYYILKGNDLLFGQNTTKAIAAYDRAIGLDKLHSVNAYYNKAKALLRPKENKDNISKARECLEQAKIMIATHLKPNLISFNSVVASTGGSKPKLLEHLQHQLNILMKQEGYIDTALKEIHKAQKEDWNLELTELKPLKEVLKEEKGDHTPAIIKANINGLQELFVLKASQPYPWKSILALALLGVAQVVVGTLIWTCTGGAAGMGLVSEGISDLLACASAAISGTFSWAQWGIQKAISLATAIFSSGLDGIKKAFQDLKKTAESIKKITFTTFKEGFKAMGKKTALELGKGTAKMLATKLLDAAVEKWGIQNMEQYIEKKVIKSLERKMRQSKFITKALELDAKNGNNNWQQIFIDEGLAILTKTDNKLMQHLKETVSILANKGIAELGEAAGGGKNATILKTFFQGATMLKAIADILLMTSEFWKEFIYQIKLKYKEELKKAIEEQVETSRQTKKEGEPGQKETGNAAPSSIEQFSIAPEPDGEIAVAQVTGDSSYSSKVETQGPGLLEYCPGAPADNGRLSNVFASHLKAKITNKIKTEIAHPLTSGIASWGIDKVSKGLTEDVNAALAAYQSKREGQIMCDDHANNQKNQGGNQQVEHKELPKEVQQRIEQLKNDGKGDITDIAKISQDLGRPIVIQDKDGQIYDIIGSKQQGDPIIVKYDPANGGHYTPADSKVQLPAGGKNDCLFTATYAQITAEERQKLGINSLEDFKNKHIESISRDAQSMQQLFQKATEMRNYNPDYVLEGGRKSQLENYQQESGESPGYFNHDPQNGVFHGFDRRPYCMKSKPDREKLVKADRKAHGIKKRFINGEEISISKEADMQKGSTCYCANCREESNSSSKNSASEPKSNNSYKHHTPRIPFLNPISTNKISNQVDFATGILRQQRRMSEFDMAIAESRAALKVAQEMKKVYEANQKEQASKLAAEAKQQAEEKARQKAAADQAKEEEAMLRAAQKARRTASARRREEIRKQSEEAARHKEAENKKRAKENAQKQAANKKGQAKKKPPTQEGQKAKKARRRANQRARRKEAAKKQAEAKKQANQGLVKQEEANIQKIAEQEENLKKDVEVKQGANPAAKRIKEKPCQQVEEKLIETRQREEEIKRQVAEAEATKKQKEQEARRAKIRKGKQKLPQREEEEPVVSAAATNFSQSLDEALNQFVNSHNQSSTEEEAIQNYSNQAQNLLQQLQQGELTSELEAQTHDLLTQLHHKTQEEFRELTVAQQIKRLLASQELNSLETNQAKGCVQQHRQNLERIRVLIDQLEHGLRSAEIGKMRKMEKVGERETIRQEAEKQAEEEANHKETVSVTIKKGISSWTEHNKHKLYKQLEEEEREAQKKYKNSLTLQNAADEVSAYLEGVKEANFSPGAQKLRGKVLLKQVEAFKKLAKHNYRMTRQIMKDMDPIPAEMARAQLLQHKSQLTAMRNLRSQLKKACPLTPEELAACKIKIKKIADKDDYESDTSDEDNDCSRSDLAFNKGIIKGIWRAFKETPQAIFEESKSLIKNPIKTIKNCIMLLEKMPALSAILQEISSYLDSIEGNEEAKGEEIGHFIAEQIIHLLLPSKTKVISSLAKVTKLNELGGKAAGIIAGELEKAGKGKKLRKGEKEINKGGGKHNKSKTNKPRSRSAAFRQAKREAGIPVNQEPYKVEKVRLVDNSGKETYIRNYYFKNQEGKQIIIPEDSLKYEFKNRKGKKITKRQEKEKGKNNKADKTENQDSKEILEETGQTSVKKEDKGETKEWNGKYKKKKPGVSDKEGAKGAPSWAKEHYPREGENGKEFAKRILDEKYGPIDHPIGANSEFSKIQKWADRSFE